MTIKTRAAGAAVVASMLALTGCGSGPAKPKVTSTVRAGVAPLPPARDGADFGAWVDPAQSLTNFEKSMGRPVDIVQTYRDWGSGFPSQADAPLLASSRTVLLTLTGGDATKIAGESLNKAITDRAIAIKKTGKPIFLRWQPDMDSAAPKAVRNPGTYVAAWKHMRQLFKAAKADNVAWVWCPSAEGFDTTTNTAAHAPDFYPGDDQVDWICADAHPDPRAPTQTFGQVLKPFMDWAAAHPKPIMIAEFGVPRDYGSRRADWLRKAAQTLQNQQVKAVLYDDSNEHGGKYSLTGDEAALSAVRELATSPFFNPRNLPVQSG